MLPPAVAAALLAPLEGMSARRRGREDWTAGTAWGMDWRTGGLEDGTTALLAQPGDHHKQWTFQFDGQIFNKGLAGVLVCMQARLLSS